MRVLRGALLTLLMSPCGAIASDNTADGFIKVQSSQYKMGKDGIFLYCDKTDAQRITCYDELIKGMGSIEGEKSKSNWRTAEQYVKYMLNDDFEYAGMTALNYGVALYYKKKIN